MNSYPANFKEYVASKIIDYLDNDLDYHYKRINMIKKEREKEKKTNEEKFLKEIREKYPKNYVLVEYTSGYCDYKRDIACFTSEETALKYMNENYKSGRSSARFREDYYIEERSSREIYDSLLIDLDNPKK